MSENVRVFNNATGTFSTINVDILVDSLSGYSETGELDYYLKFTTSARDTGNFVVKSKVSRGLQNLALTHSNASAKHQSWQNSQADYANINELVNDFIYDMVNGHTSDQYGSGVPAQLPMSF